MSIEANKPVNQTDIADLQAEVAALKDEIKNLLVAKKQVEDDCRKKSLLLAKMNHEIRTPMNSIVGFAQLLDDPDVDSETKSEFIKIITNSSHYLLELINDIIDIAKIESNQIEVNKTVVILSDFLEEIKEMTYGLLDENDLTDAVNIHLKNTVLPQYDRIVTDEKHLKQIFKNLILNAIKLTKEGTITIEATVKDNQIYFTISDTGRGIEKDKLPLLFDYYWHIDDDMSKKYNGSGLRLSVVKLLTELLGGNIKARSEIGKGTTMTLSFPLTLPTEVTGHLEENSSGTVVSVPDLSNKTILIVEDDEYSFQLLKLLLKPTGVSLLRAHNGEEAVEQFRKTNSIHLILMDMMLPQMDGLQAGKKIMKIRNIPIIIQTANVLHGERSKVLEAGCADYITKPINKDELYLKIKRHIR